MESKVKEYLKAYEKFEKTYAKSQEYDAPIQSIRREIDALESKKRAVDYTDLNVVTSRMKQYIDDLYYKRVEDISLEVEQEMSRINQPTGKVQANFNKVCTWLGRETAISFVKDSSVDFTRPMSIEKAESAAGFNAWSALNSILGFIFRFAFLTFLPKLIRVIIGAIVWLIILEAFHKVNHFVLVVIIATNVIAYLMAKNSAKQYLVDNHAVCLALISPNELKSKLYEFRLSEFQNNYSNAWYNELNEILTGGLERARENDANAIYPRIRNELENQYNGLCSQVVSKENSIKQLEDQQANALREAEEMVPVLNAMEDGVDNLIVFNEHNEGVISPYVSLGFSVNELMGAKKLITIRHDVKPVIICYTKQTAKNGEQFRKNMARIIEQMMNGFYYENYYGFINMSLVDFESLHFPESRTKGLMSVLRSREELNRLFAELKETRKSVDSLMDGRIASINPEMLKKRENTIKYNIVFCVGYDFSGLDNETSQLFVGGENFGFVPIIFMDQDEAKKLLEEEASSKAFARVVRQARDAGNIYSFESIVSEFLYEAVVTSRTDVEEILNVKQVVSYETFIEEVGSERGFELDRNYKTYFDVSGLDEDVYTELVHREDIADLVRFFTLDGQIPDYIDQSKVMFL